MSYPLSSVMQVNEPKIIIPNSEVKNNTEKPADTGSEE